MSSIEKFLKDHKIEEVECLVPDMAGIGRGKILPAERFVDGMKKNGLRIPEALFVQTVTGDYPQDDTVASPATSDVYLRPDSGTIRVVPWYPEPTAQVICDPYYFDGSPVAFSARQVLKRVSEEQPELDIPEIDVCEIASTAEELKKLQDVMKKAAAENGKSSIPH